MPLESVSYALDRCLFCYLLALLKATSNSQLRRSIFHHSISCVPNKSSIRGILMALQEALIPSSPNQLLLLLLLGRVHIWANVGGGMTFRVCQTVTWSPGIGKLIERGNPINSQCRLCVLIHYPESGTPATSSRCLLSMRRSLKGGGDRRSKVRTSKINSITRNALVVGAHNLLSDWAITRRSSRSPDYVGRVLKCVVCCPCA